MAEQELIQISEVPDLVEKKSGWRPELRTVRGWAKAGKVQSKKIGGRMFVRKDSLNRMLDAAEK